MKSELLSSSFEEVVPEVDNIYELVVVAAQRARQLNEFQMHMPSEAQINPVEKALGEVYVGDIEYQIIAPDEIRVKSEETVEEKKG